MPIIGCMQIINIKAQKKVKKKLLGEMNLEWK